MWRYPTLSRQPVKFLSTSNSAYEYQHEFRIVTGHDCDIDFIQEDRDGVTHNVFNGYIPYQGLRLGSLDDIAELLTFQ